MEKNQAFAVLDDMTHSIGLIAPIVLSMSNSGDKAIGYKLHIEGKISFLSKRAIRLIAKAHELHVEGTNGLVVY